MQTRLKILYQLQLIDDQLDELEELRGDLPNTVNTLKFQINELREEIKKKEKEKEDSLERRQLNEEEIEKLKESQKKFKAQLYQVRNNKEYDALTKEIDHTEETIKRLEAENDALADKSKTLSAEIEEIIPKVEELEKELKEKEADLKEIIKANEKEENKLLEERKKVEAQVKKPDLSVYTRIRKAKKGKAVVTIKRSACSGCHNIIPSQRQLEIRRNDKIFTCEYCGRILVSQEIAEEVEKSK
ncbi:Zn-ribbon protein [Ignavibacterium album JCM 16511]|uniref:Zn-ribbon protein n=1 Tax=Ignavibacterium album (strain DSM 19864 / JCM 16511 / NBRC 101810 / Mat9-16) TaxID=945713 RepID=I0AGC4_IGNAJ|nr:C4-type zinc ribbon domain-containing protein [Ignavibacterium album]AFH48031.1 Zn-ribbon protein [Ignavibacterium album JCM 16511]